MTDERLAQLERLLQEATEGPWNADPEMNDYIFDLKNRVVARTYDSPNGEFIAESRTALPELVADVRRLRGTLARIAQYLNGTNDPRVMADALDWVYAECIKALGGAE